LAGPVAQLCNCCLRHLSFMHVFEYSGEDFGYLVRLTIALVLTGLLGWERNRSGKSAGVRTHMIVGMGACFFMILPEAIISHYRSFGSGVQFDPLRVIQAVVAGISFVGAGTIFVSDDKDHVKGLTTAASIWTCTAIGMCVGVGRVALAAGATLLLLIVLYAIRKIEPEEGEGRVFGDGGEQQNSGGQIAQDESASQSAKRRANPGAS
jgi:putative Mg2+ transporter-C (MgtC) family protein